MESVLWEQQKDLLYGITPTVKHEIRKQEGEFLLALLAFSAASLVQPMLFSVVEGISGSGVRREGTGYVDIYF